MRPNLHQLPVSGNSSGFRMPGAGRPRCNEWIRLAPALIAAMGLAHGKARADPGGPVVVGGGLVRGEGQGRGGRCARANPGGAGAAGSGWAAILSGWRPGLGGDGWSGAPGPAATGNGS